MNFDNNLENIRLGIEGQSIFYNFLKTKKHKFMQLDSVSRDPVTGKWYVWEIKHQERFNGPPFDGHGLPVTQLNDRIKYCKETNQIPILAIIEPQSDTLFNQPTLMFIQYMEVLKNLTQRQKFITKTGSRIIFDLKAFKKIELNL